MFGQLLNMLGKILSVVGWGIIAFLFFTAFMEIKDTAGGFENLVNQSVENPEYRENMMWFGTAYSFITPLWEVDVLGKKINFSLDSFSILMVAIISIIITFLAVKFAGISLGWAVLLFFVVFFFTSLLWEGFWVSKLYEHGQALGMTSEQVTNIIMESKLITENPLLLFLSLFSVGFIFYKGRGAMPI